MNVKYAAMSDITTVVDDYETEKVLYEGPLSRMPADIVKDDNYSFEWMTAEKWRNPYGKPTLIITVY